MEQHLKQRLLGTVVLVATAVIVLPLLLDGAGYRALQDIKIAAPQRPPFKYQQNGFTTPLRDLDNKDLLDAPPPVEVKEFDKNADDAVSAEHDKAEPQPNEPSPPEAADAPPPASEVEPATTWVVQVGSFSVEENAMATHKKLAAMNAENATIETETEKIDGQNVYVVKVVSNDYESLSQITALIKKDYPDAFIKERE